MKALDGIKVLDLTHALAGPFCTYQLQLLGAEVIKIEKPEEGDDFRTFGAVEGWSSSPSFIAVNGGKRSVTVNLKSEAGRDVIKRLAADADVIVENLRPGVAKKLGLGWDDLKAVNPGLVYCSISGFGQAGEMSQWPAYDHTIKAITGMMWSGAEDDIPSQARGFSVDCFTGYLAYAAILAGLLRKARTGAGQYLDVAMFDSAMVLMGVGVVRQLMTGDQVSATQPIVHERPTVAPYRTRDGWLWLSANFQPHWVALCEVLDARDLLADPRFADVRSRAKNAPALRAFLAERIAPMSAETLEAALMAAGCPAAQVRLTRQALDLPVVAERGLLQEGAAGGRPVSLLNAGFVADVDSPELSGPVPDLGRDTDAVLRELGYTDQEIAGLHAEAAV